MSRYEVKAVVSGLRIDSVKKKLAEIFQVSEGDVFSVELQAKGHLSRADRLSNAEGMVEDARSIVEELLEEMEEWRDSIPENLQGGDKASQIEESISALEDLMTNFDQLDFGSVDFPGMF